MADSVKIRIEGDDSPFQSTLSGLGKTAGTAFKGIATGIAVVSAAATAAGLSIIKTGADFTAAMSEVQAISGASADEMERLTQVAKDYGASTSFSASEAASALKYMALAGWDSNKSIAALPGVLNLAAASGMELGAAADMVTDYLSAFSMEADQAAYFSDMLAYAQGRSNTSAAGLGEAYKNCAANMNAAGQDVETTTAMLMGMANQGLKGAQAGTSLTAIMRDVSNNMENGAIQIGKTSIAVMDANGNFRDFTDICFDVESAVAGMGTAERSAALSTTFTADSIKGMNLILNEGVGNIASYEDGLRGATGAAEEMASTMLDNLSGDITMFQSALDGLKITAFDDLDGPARHAVQMATEIINGMNDAYRKGGLDGLVDNITAQIPKLTTAGVNAATKMFSAVSKKLPGMVKSLLSTVPDLLNSAMDLAPQLSDTFFSIAGTAVESVIGQLPQLLPNLLSGIGKLGLSALLGGVNLVDSIFGGMRTALQSIGVIGYTTDELYDGLLANYDPNHVEELRPMFSIEPEVTVEPVDFELRSIYDDIETILTDGEADTPEIIADLEKRVTDYYENQIALVNQWRANALANLDDTLPEDEYMAAAQNINTQADNMVAGLQDASNATIAFIEDNAGKATAAVQNNLDELEGIYNNAVDYRDKIMALTGESMNELNYDRQLVAAGMVKDEGTIANALTYTAMEYADAVEEANQIKAAALAKARQDSAQGLVDYDTAEARILDDHTQALEAAKNTFEANMAMLWSGVTDSLSPELAENLNAAEALSVVRDHIQGLRDIITDAVNDPRIASGEIDATEFIANALAELNLSDADYIALAQQLGIDSVDPSYIQQELIRQMTDSAKWESTGNSSIFGDLLAKLLSADGIDAQINGLLESINVDSGPVADLMQAAIQEGVLDGIESIDLSTAEGRLALALGDFGDLSYATIGKDTEVPAPVNMVPDPQFDESSMGNVGEQASEIVQDSVEQAPPAEATQQVTVTTETTVTEGDDTGLQDAVEAELQPQTMSVDIKADVSLSVNVSDSNASEVGQAAGEEVSAGIESGITAGAGDVQTAASGVMASAASAARSGASAASSAGRNFTSGLASGILAGRSSVVSAATAVASAAASALRSALSIHSPSRITYGMGRYFDLGFAKGQLDNLREVSSSSIRVAQAAVSSVNNIIGPANFAPRINTASLTGALGDTLQGFADIETERPIALYINGKEMGRVMSSDNARAANNLNRSIALGYGK